MGTNIAIHPSTNMADAAATAWRQGRHLKTVDGVVYMAPGRDPDQFWKSLRLRALLTFAADLRK